MLAVVGCFAALASGLKESGKILGAEQSLWKLVCSPTVGLSFGCQAKDMQVRWTRESKPSGCVLYLCCDELDPYLYHYYSFLRHFLGKSTNLFAMKVGMLLTVLSKDECMMKWKMWVLADTHSSEPSQLSQV